MSQGVLLVHPDDDMVVALRDQAAGVEVPCDDGQVVLLRESIPAKHKFARRNVSQGGLLKMYGITVGRAVTDISAGQLLTTANVVHAVDEVGRIQRRAGWIPPDVSRWKDQTFLGYHRDDGRVGTSNYWLVVPLVFCENRNLQVLQEALLDELGYGRRTDYRSVTRRLLTMHQEGTPASQLTEVDVTAESIAAGRPRVFPNVDGIKFLRHEGGCGGTYEDAVNLCGLLASYINHPNVAGATVLSLGCQKSEVRTLEQQLHRRNANFKKPLYIVEQQQLGTEHNVVCQAIKQTFAGIVTANRLGREPAGLKHITLGVECGGSDGFSGISANPAIGHCSDMLVALGGSVILSEFPELAGCEQDLSERCVDRALADRFLQIMRDYDRLARAVGGGFEANPSPGNIQDGLITDAIKSVGAAKKGGTSPVVDVLDFPENISKRGLSLLCTPGGDVESTTAMAGAGATVQAFSTGLGTPTGNPITPVIKVSSNSELAARMPDIIDVDAGGIVNGAESIESVGERLFEMVLRCASGDYVTCAQRLGQDDFIPWKRGISF